MEAELKKLAEEAHAAAGALQTRAQWEACKAQYLGASGALKAALKGMAKVPKEDKPAVGKLVNSVKIELEALFEAAGKRVQAAALAEKLGPSIDVSLPPPPGALPANPAEGSLHPLTATRNALVEIFSQIGFTVAEGTEVETAWHSFDALNTPPEHPARSETDTYYLPNPGREAELASGGDESSVQPEWATVTEQTGAPVQRYLLRPHTSSVQIRTLLQEGAPVRIVAPGRCFRRDTADATHSANFHQMEGMYVDKNVSVADLKAVLDYAFTQLLGKGVQTRFRPHNFPYTEPSFEVDFSAKGIGGKAGQQWVEIMGCGIMHPSVLEGAGICPKTHTGFAFGMGLERIAMILHGIDDIRHFYQNDVRFLKQF